MPARVRVVEGREIWRRRKRGKQNGADCSVAGGPAMGTEGGREKGRVGRRVGFRVLFFILFLIFEEHYFGI